MGPGEGGGRRRARKDGGRGGQGQAGTRGGGRGTWEGWGALDKMGDIYRITADLDHITSHHSLFLSSIMAAANPLVVSSALKDIISPQFHQNSFPAESYIKSDLGIKLDKGLPHSLSLASCLHRSRRPDLQALPHSRGLSSRPSPLSATTYYTFNTEFSAPETTANTPTR